jgi:hypothetical protein
MYWENGHQLTAEDDVERVRASFLHSPKKSTGTAAKELSMSKTTVWRVLRKRLVFKPYHHGEHHETPCTCLSSGCNVLRVIFLVSILMWKVWSSPYLYSARNTQTVDRPTHLTTINTYLNCDSAIKCGMRFNGIEIPIVKVSSPVTGLEWPGRKFRKQE